jgi:hypothetical protein
VEEKVEVRVGGFDESEEWEWGEKDWVYGIEYIRGLVV